MVSVFHLIFLSSKVPYNWCVILIYVGSVYVGKYWCVHFKQWEQDGYRLSRKRSEFPFSCWCFSLLHVFLQPPYHIQSIINLQRTTCLLSLGGEGGEKDTARVRLTFHICVSHSLVPVINKLKLCLRWTKEQETKLNTKACSLVKENSVTYGHIYITFWAAVRSSANALARFLAHWLSCMAEAWSLIVGTVALAAVTILAPGWQWEKGHSMSQNVCSQTHFSKIRTASWKDWAEQRTCRKFWLAPIRASWALGLSGCAWLPLTPCTSWGIWSATTCQVNNSCIRKTSWTKRAMCIRHS